MLEHMYSVCTDAKVFSMHVLTGSTFPCHVGGHESMAESVLFSVTDQVCGLQESHSILSSEHASSYFLKMELIMFQELK